MSELTDHIDAMLLAAYHQRVVDYGYWCPRCDIDAGPREDPVELGVTLGWCPFCGLDPLADGPAQPMYATGIIGLLDASQEQRTPSG